MELLILTFRHGFPYFTEVAHPEDFRQDSTARSC